MRMMSQKVPELVKIGDFLEDGIKSWKIQSMAALQVTSKAIQSGTIANAKNRKEKVSGIVPFYQPGLPPRANQCTISTHTQDHPAYALLYNTQPYYNLP